MVQFDFYFPIKVSFYGDKMWISAGLFNAYLHSLVSCEAGGLQ